MSADVGPRVFISYRREDSEGHAGRLYDALTARFGAEQVFMDVDAIPLGVDFAQVIEKAVGSCDVLIAVIGREWLSIEGSDGHRRLDNPDDFVRLEIRAALSRDVRVIPTLVHGAQMPGADKLPEDISGLVRRNGIQLRGDSWGAGITHLINAIENVPGSHPRPDENELEQLRQRSAAVRKPVEAAEVAAAKAMPVTSRSPATRAAVDGSRRATFQPVRSILTRRVVVGLWVSTVVLWVGVASPRNGVNLAFVQIGVAAVATAATVLAGNFQRLPIAAGLLVATGIVACAKYVSSLLAELSYGLYSGDSLSLLRVAALGASIALIVFGIQLARLADIQFRRGGPDRGGWVEAMLLAMSAALMLLTDFAHLGWDYNFEWPKVEGFVIGFVVVATSLCLPYLPRQFAAGLVLALGIESITLWTWFAYGFGVIGAAIAICVGCWMALARPERVPLLNP
jgi:hypothetical protein